MDFSRNNIVKIMAMILVAALSTYVGYIGSWYMAIVGIAAIILIYLMLKTAVPLIRGRLHLYALAYQHEDKDFFDLPDPRTMPSESVGTETWTDADRKPYWPYWLKSRMGTLNILVLDPGIQSLEISPVHFYLPTNIEYRNIGQFRTYIEPIISRVGREDYVSLLDKLKASSISFERRRRQQKPEQKTEKPMEELETEEE